MGVATGATVDNDTFALEDSFRALISGHYQPSRTSGYPLYEGVGAIVWAMGGRPATMVLAGVLTIAALILLIRPTRALLTWLGAVCWGALALSPLVLTNASAVMETPAVLLGLGLLAWVVSQPSGGRRWNALLALSCGALVLIRPDAVLIVGATAAALLLCRVDRGLKARAVTSACLGAGVALLVVMLLSGRFPFLSTYLQDEPALRRLARGIIGSTTVLGVVGCVALVILCIALGVFLWRSRGTGTDASASALLDDPRFVSWWLLLTVVLYGVRFLALSDELEYLLPLIVVLAVSIPRLTSVGKVAIISGIVAIGSVASTSVLVVSFLGRTDPWQVEAAPMLTVNPGGFWQDLNARRAQTTRESPTYQDFLAASVPSHIQAIEDGTTVVLPRDSRYYVVNAGYRDYYAKVDTIVGCRELTTGTLIPGWRISQPAGSYEDLAAFERSEPMQCAIVATLKDGVVTPIAEP